MVFNRRKKLADHEELLHSGEKIVDVRSSYPIEAKAETVSTQTPKNAVSEEQALMISRSEKHRDDTLDEDTSNSGELVRAEKAGMAKTKIEAARANCVGRSRQHQVPNDSPSVDDQNSHDNEPTNDHEGIEIVYHCLQSEEDTTSESINDVKGLIIPQLLKELFSNDVNEVNGVLSKLSLLLCEDGDENKHERYDYCRLDAPTAIVSAMRRFENESKIQSKCVHLLQKLSVEEEAQTRFISLGAIQTLTKAMRTFPNHICIQENGCAILSNMFSGSGSEESKTIAYKCGALSAILDAKTRHSENQGVQLAAFGALCLHNNRTTAVAAKAAEAVVAGTELAASLGLGSTEKQAQAAWLISSILEL